MQECLTQAGSITLGKAASHGHCIYTRLEVTWGKENTEMLCMATARWAKAPTSLSLHRCPLNRNSSQKPLQQPKEQLPLPRERSAAEQFIPVQPRRERHSLMRCHLETQLSSGLIIAMILWERAV